MSENVFDVLKKRGFIDQITAHELEKALKKPMSFYVGFDPTADSLHIGHLVAIIALTWLQKYGHKGYALIGGATARIGDPSGKSIERPLLDDISIQNNISEIDAFLKEVVQRNCDQENPITIVNNQNWYQDFSCIDFLRDVGRYFRLGTMLAKESVKIRVNSEEGMSFTEFSYQVLQSYDFYHLHKQHGITLQLGGSDQWGNITAGIDFGRKMGSDHLFGLTFPLLTRSDGKKFGKTESGAVWLSSKRLSPYQFYQYFMKIPDADVIQMMKMLTFMDFEEIEELEQMMWKEDYVPNTAQKRLAKEVTFFVHGSEGLAVALKVTEAIIPGSPAKLDGEILREISSDMPHVTLNKEDLSDKTIADIFAMSKLTTSKSEATKLIKNGGAYLNNQKIDNPALEIAEKDLIDGQYILLSRGKKNRLLISFM